MAIETELLLHPSDQAALKALKAIPGFSQVLKAFMNVMNERQFRILNMSSRVKLSEEQMPEYYRMLYPICDRLGIKVPELYLEMNVVPNAYTYGDTEPFIVLTSGLLNTLPNELIPSVLAHECGHIACHHTLYSTMGNLILSGVGNFLTGVSSLLSIPMKMAFAYWMRCSEFSADRAAILCDGSAEKMIDVCFRLAGNDKGIHATTDVSSFLKQAVEYRQMISGNNWNKTLEFFILSGCDHPLLAVRALEAQEWGASAQYQRVLSLAESREIGRLTDSSELPVLISSKEAVGREYRSLAEELSNEGFKHIQLQRATVAPPGFHSGQVTSMLIDDTKEVVKGAWLSVNDLLVISYYEPLTAEEKRAVHPGQLEMPDSARAYIGKDYLTVAQELFNAGFKDIETKIVYVKRSFLSREGTITHIQVGDCDVFEKGDWVKEDSVVTITYQKFSDTAEATGNSPFSAVNAFIENFRTPKQ